MGRLWSRVTEHSLERGPISVFCVEFDVKCIEGFCESVTHEVPI